MSKNTEAKTGFREETSPLKIRVPSGETCSIKIDAVTFQISIHSTWDGNGAYKPDHFVAALDAVGVTRLSEVFATDGEVKEAYRRGFTVPENKIAQRIARALVEEGFAEQMD